MVKKTKNSTQPDDPEAEEKKRLRSLALSKRLLRRGSPAETAAPLRPAKSVVKLDGRDVVKRGQRRSRFLFSFPGLLAPLSGGRIGELACLASKNPILYLEFPQVGFSFLTYSTTMVFGGSFKGFSKVYETTCLKWVI